MIEALKHPEIINVFLGDQTVPPVPHPNFEDKNLSMPYLTHSDLNGLIGSLDIFYDLSALDDNRKTKMQRIIDKVIEFGKVDNFLNYFFSPQRYVMNYRGSYFNIDQKDITAAINIEIEAYLEYINSILLYSDKELVRYGKKVVLKNLENTFNVKHNIEDHIDHHYIRTLPDRVKTNFDLENYDSVITQCRTTIEEINIFILEEKGVDYSSCKGNIQKLNTLVRKTLKMQPNKDYDSRISDLLNGLNKINDAIANMRNNYSDSHGVGKGRIKVEKREARLVINATLTYCDYLLDVYEDSINR